MDGPSGPSLISFGGDLMRRSLVFLLPLLLAVASNALQMEFEFDPDNGSALPSAVSKAVNEAFDLNKKGLEALENKRFDEALDAFNKALQVLPDYEDAENNRGVAYFRKGNIGDAQKIWEALASKNPKYATASYNLGLLYLHEHRPEAALQLFERALKANGRFVEALVRYGTTELELGKREKGVEYLHKAYKLAPKHPDAWSFYAYALVANGDTSQAVTILKANSSDVKALRLLGSIEAGRKNSKEASRYFSAAVARGADPSLLVELASSQLESGSCREALATLQNYFAMKIQHSADAWLAAGIAAKECGKMDDARRYFSDGVKKYPSDPILAYNLGQIYFHQKRFDDAEATWEGLSDSLQDPSLLYLRAIGARKKGNLTGARSLIEKALSMDNRAEFHDFLGVIHHQQKDDKGAGEEFRKALKINPELRSAQLNLALLSRKDEDLTAVAADLQKKISGCTGDDCTSLSLQLAILYYHRKMIDKAVEVLLAVKEPGRDERIYRHIALFYREMQEWDKAIAALEKAAKSFVIEPQTEYELAEDYLFAGYHAKAVERFQKLIPRWTENPWRLYYQMGYAWLEQNNLDQAQACFEKSIKSKHDNVAARGLLAFVLNRKGNTAEAQKLWEKNLQDDPDNPALWINMGLALERDRRYEEALSHYQRAAMLNKNDRELQINIGNAYLGLRRYSEAMDAYSQALSTPKRNLAAYNTFIAAEKKKDRDRAEKMLAILQQEFSGSVYAKRCASDMAVWKGDTAGAVRILEGLSEKDDADWIALARLYADQQKPQKARDCLKNVSSSDAMKTETAEVEAKIAFGSGDYSEAMRLMKTAGDTGFAAQYNIAVTAYHAKQFAQALDIAQRLSHRASGRDRADVCRLAGNSAFSLKKWDDARQWYLQLSNVEANSAVVQYNLAVACYNLDRIDDAWRYYQRAKGLDPGVFNKDIEAKYRQKKGAVTDSTMVLDSTDVWYNQAVDLQQQGNDSAAEKLYHKVLAKDSTNPLAWNNLGAIYGKRGDIDNAENAYFKAIEKRHDVPETYANLVNLYIELEEFSKARKWIIKGIGHNPDSDVLAQLRERIPEAEKEAQERKRNAAADASDSAQ